MSVYNKGEFLHQAIQSILEQSFTDFEFIIRDNQSADNSIEVIIGFTDQRINFARNSRNLGPVGSLNNCIEAAQGDYITFAHGDDIWDKEFLATHVAHLEMHPSVKMSHSLMHCIKGQDGVIEARPEQGVGEYLIEGYEDVLKKLFKGCFVKTPTAFFRRNAIRFYDVRYIYTCDWDMYLQIAVAGNDFLFVNKPLLSYRVSDTSETAVGMKHGDLILESYLTLRNFFDRHQEYRRFRRKSFKRLSDSVLRRSRDVGSRDTLYFFFCCAILCYPLQVLNPGFYLYLFLGLLFGPRGVHFLKNSSRFFKRLIRGHG